MKKILTLILIVCVVGIGIYFYLTRGTEDISQKEKLPSGEEEALLEEYDFNVSSTDGIYPKFKSGKFSKRPFDIVVDTDKELETSIKVEDPDGVSEVKLVVVGQKDNLEKEINLELTEGDLFSGVWSGKLEIPSQMERIVWTNFYAENKKGKIDDLSLDWIPGATCQVSTSGSHAFGNCNCAGGETVGTNNGQITVTGTVNLSGVSGSPAYLVYGTKVVFSGGKIVFSNHVGGKATAILIKKGKVDSVKSKAAAICAYYNNIKCNPDGSTQCEGANTPSGNGGWVKRKSYRCSSGSCAEQALTIETCGKCKYCSGASCHSYGNRTRCGGTYAACYSATCYENYKNGKYWSLTTGRDVFHDADWNQIAPKRCKDLVEGGFSDWRLPSYPGDICIGWGEPPQVPNNPFTPSSIWSGTSTCCGYPNIWYNIWRKSYNNCRYGQGRVENISKNPDYWRCVRP